MTVNGWGVDPKHIQKSMQTCRQNVVNMYEHVVFYHVLPDESAWDDGNGADMAHRFLTL